MVRARIAVVGIGPGVVALAAPLLALLAGCVGDPNGRIVATGSVACEGTSECAEVTELPETFTPYVEGSDGFVRLVVAHDFEGTMEVASHFGVSAQFFAPITGGELIDGEVLDPLEGIDDCGVTRDGHIGLSGRFDWRRVAEATLFDAGDAIPLVEIRSGEQLIYGVTLDRAPRFGERYGVHLAGAEFGAAFDSDDIELPQALSVETFEQAAHFDGSDIALRWSGSGQAPLGLQLVVTACSSALAGEVEIQCLVEDDGEFTIPAAVLQAAPQGPVQAYATRANRTLQTAAGHHIVVDAKIENGYRFALGPACED